MGLDDDFMVVLSNINYTKLTKLYLDFNSNTKFTEKAYNTLFK